MTKQQIYDAVNAAAERNAARIGRLADRVRLDAYVPELHDGREIWTAALQAALTAQGTNINAILQKVQNSGGLTSCIRKIQRGTSNIGSKDSTVDITLSGFSKLDKMIVILNGYSYYDSNFLYPVYVAGLTVSKLTVGGYSYSSSKSGKTFSYHVIEFY
jgi:hypothetical protein